MSESSDWDFGFQSDPGRKRQAEPNQDTVLVLPGLNGKAPLLVVADGMGGHRGGETASRLLVETLSAFYQQAALPTDYGELLANCLRAAHSALRAHAAQHKELESMGSTAVIAALDGQKLHIANVGDSRAYLLSGREMKQVNFDHSEVADQLRAGVITFLQALRHPRRNRLTQSISARRPEINPFVAQISLGPDDTVLLCSDGLWGVVADAVVQAVALELTPQQAAEKLVMLANTSQSPDNVSVVIARRKNAKLQSTLNEAKDKTNPGLF